ncbi:MAG: long-chain fatty acid--CoA ligase [Bacteroidota bacterium]
MLNLATLLEDAASRYPERVAFIFSGHQFTFAQINGAANQVANGLAQRGLGSGDKVALSCFNLPYFPMVYFGILKAGCVVVPLSVLLKTDEIAYHLDDSDAKAYCCFTGTADLPMAQMGYAGFSRIVTCKHFFEITVDPTSPATVVGAATLGSLMAGQPPTTVTVATQAEDTAVIIYTSGTTGRPKGAELTHANLVLNAIASQHIIGTETADTQLIVLPLFHIFAMTCLMNTGIYRGATSVLLPRFDAAAVIGLMRKHKVTVFAGVPTMYWGLLNYEDDVSDVSENLRVAVSGGAALPLNVLEGFESKFKVPILEGYGMSEGSPVVTFNHRDQERKPGSVGTSIWGVEVKVVDENDQEVGVGEKGEIVYRGHNVMKGYYKRPEASAETLRNGWMHSGDVAIKDEDGYFFIVDRTKDMIIRGGLNVYPREVEEVMIQHEAVSLVAVIGVSDEKMGEEIKAYVVLNDGHQCLAEDLIIYTKEKLAAYKYPREIEFLDALPMSATGKILKKELRKR